MAGTPRAAIGHPLGRAHLRPRQRAPARVGAATSSSASRASLRTRPCSTSAAAPGASPRRCSSSSARTRAGRRRLPGDGRARPRASRRARAGVLQRRARARARSAGGRDRLHRHAALGDRPRAPVAALAGACARAGGSRPSAAGRGTSRACARRSQRPPASSRLSWWASRRGTSRAPRTPPSGWRGRASSRCAAGWSRARPARGRGAFIRTSILAAHLERLAVERREPFAEAVAARVRLPLDYVRLNISARRAMLG